MYVIDYFGGFISIVILLSIFVLFFIIHACFGVIAVIFVLGFSIICELCP